MPVNKNSLLQKHDTKKYNIYRKVLLKKISKTLQNVQFKQEVLHLFIFL